MIEYLKRKHPLYEEAKNRGYKDSVKFISLRPVIQHECETCSEHNIFGVCGNTIKYSPDTDTLYVSGRGLYVIMEKGIWVNFNNSHDLIPREPQYEIY